MALWALARYAGLLALDIVRSGIGVAAIVLNPRLPIRPGILAIPSECESELGVALSSHALSVTPGELVVGVDDEGDALCPLPGRVARGGDHRRGALLAQAAA